MPWYSELMHVAVGIVISQYKEILIAKRPAHKYKGGLWEFPGGKLEAGETVFKALERELLEEIGIQIITATPWLQITHDYTDRKVLLDAWLITQYSGVPMGRESQEICWIKPSSLSQFEFPAGNRVIIEKLISMSL